MQRHLFTLEEANSLVPWLERAFQHLNTSTGRLEDLRGRVEELHREQRRLNGTFELYNEANQMQAELEELSQALQKMVDEISAVGIIVRDVSTGLVDFPHMRQGREVYLCWISGEESIEFWHETNRGFAHRQPL